jgi:hypothetical protein
MLKSERRKVTRRHHYSFAHAPRGRDPTPEESPVDELYAELERSIIVAGLLGYLNFSDGRPDARWQKQINEAYAFLAKRGIEQPWRALSEWLIASLPRLQAGGAAAFRDVSQAESVLAAGRDLLPAYRAHHVDLLAHLSDAELFQPFFLVRTYEAILAQRAAGDGAIDLAAVLARLNDFIGYRPLAILETRPQGEPYDHERTRPVPLYIQGPGVAWGRYRDLVAQALEILSTTDPNLLAEAQFDLKLLDELALDVRPYDHGHPVNRRPNYVFGEWDPSHLDNQGRYRRYVARQITLDALLERVEQPGAGTREERAWEAAAVFAGTILMAAGVSGNSPTAHDSTTTLATLLPRVARYRDAFYRHLLDKLNGAHAARLRKEEATTRQPFGAARQHLNSYLARHRATQLQQRQLSLIFAEMGYPDASRDEARRIPAVSLRLLSEIMGRLTSGRVEVDQGQLRSAAQRLPEVEDLLRRGIGCGGLADPWNIIGFQGLFPLSPAREDSIRDPRLEELVQVIEHVFNLYARLMSEAAAAGDKELVQTLTANMQRLATWWDRFATAEVGELRRVHGGEAASSAEHVAMTLAEWHERGEATSDLAFWRGLLEGFRSPKSFALVVDTLLRKADYRAAMALLINWLGQAEQVPLEDGVYSFPVLALRWMLAVTRPDDADPLAGRASDGAAPSLARPANESRRELVEKFFDYLEANAEDFWQVPTLELPDADTNGSEEVEDLYSAAYDDVTYQDSTNDDEGAVSDGGGPVEEFDLERESDRLEKRLRFHSTLARLWQIAARSLANTANEPAAPSTHERIPVLPNWLATARNNQQRLLGLLDAIHAYPVPKPTGTYDSMVEFDRRRVLKEQLLYTTIATCLDMALAVSALQGATTRQPERKPAPNAAPWEPYAIELEQALFSGDPAAARRALVPFVEHFQAEPLLTTPLTEGGTPRHILRVRISQTILRALLANLPRLGLLRETFELLRTARAMEHAHSSRGRGVTEFNHFFQSSYQSVVESLIESARQWSAEHAGDSELVDLLERVTAPFLKLWIEHSRTLQLSVLETLQGESDWQALHTFIQRYGGDLFHARFMTLSNLRGILSQGVGAYLDYLRDNPDPLKPIRLLDDLGDTIRHDDAVKRLEFVLQAVVENYEEFKDYNTTTAQSDYGENLYVLLDFLRLKAAYERQAWQLKPLVLAHEMLARHGRTQAALLWEQSLTRLTHDLAKHHLDQLARLERSRGVRLGTVSDRLNERFIKPLTLDRLCALIEPSMVEARRPGDRTAFARLQQELAAYTATPTGVGLDVPFWLRRLEMEVHRVQATHTTIAMLAEHFFRVPRKPLAFDELQQQLRDWDRPALPQ